MRGFRSIAGSFVLFVASVLDAPAETCAQLQQEYQERMNALIGGTGFTYDAANAARINQLQAILPSCRNSSPQPQQSNITPKFDPKLRSPTPHESMVMAALAFIGKKSQLGRSPLDWSIPLSAAVENQPTMPVPPLGFLAPWEQLIAEQPKAAPFPPGYDPFTGRRETSPPAISGNDLLFNKSSITTISPTKQPASPGKGSAANCPAGMRPAAQGNGCELDPRQAPVTPPTQATAQPQPAGSYAACVGVSTGFGQSAAPAYCEMGGYYYFRNGEIMKK